MRAQPRRQLLLDTALELFNEQGYHATGIDLILGRSGVSKATLYKHFRSKDELILSALTQRHEQIFSVMGEALESSKMTGFEQPALSLFDVLHQQINGATFFGCNFINACSEFTEASNEIHKYAAQHKENVRELLMEYLIEKNEQVKQQQSEMLLLLMDGAIINAQVRGHKNSAKIAKIAAEKLLA